MSAAPSARALGPGDARAYLALRAEMLAESPWSFLSSPDDDALLADPSLFPGRVEGQAAIFAVEEVEGGGLLAVAGVYRLPRAKVRHRASVWGVYTTPHARRRGLARVVVQAAVDAARGWDGVDSVMLSASADAPQAVALYTDLGFRTWGVEPGAMWVDDVRRDEVHMVLTFDQ